MTDWLRCIARVSRLGVCSTRRGSNPLSARPVVSPLSVDARNSNFSVVGCERSQFSIPRTFPADKQHEDFSQRVAPNYMYTLPAAAAFLRERASVCSFSRRRLSGVKILSVMWKMLHFAAALRPTKGTSRQNGALEFCYACKQDD